MLALNDSMTEVIHLSTKCCGQCPVPLCDLHVGRVRISPSNVVCNFWVMVDSAGTMSTHVFKLC